MLWICCSLLWICCLCCLFVVHCCLWFIVQCCLSIVYVVYLLFMLSMVCCPVLSKYCLCCLCIVHCCLWSMVYCPLLSITIKQSNYQEKVKRKISYKHCKHLLITYQKAIKTQRKTPSNYNLKALVLPPETHGFTP